MGITQSLRDSLTRRLFAGRIAEMEHVLSTVAEAYRSGPYLLTEEALVQQLLESDNSYLIDYVLRQRGYQLMGSSPLSFSESDRLRVVEESRHMYHYDVQVARAVTSWTDFGFGQKVEVVPRDAALQSIWEEFWSSRRNAPVLKSSRIHKLSNDLIVDGELFLVFYRSTVDGLSTIRRIDSPSIQQIICERGDRDVPLYYVTTDPDSNRQLYLPDWRASEDQLQAVNIPPSVMRVEDLSMKIPVNGKPTPVTSASVLHVAYDILDGRGWPILSRTYRWARVLRDFLGDRAAVARRVAMFVDEFTHSAGSRGQTALESRMQSALAGSSWGADTNPPAPAGSTLIHNQAVDVARRPLSTGASDAEADGQMFAGQVSAGSSLPLHFMGWPQALANRATAREMARPWVAQLDRYQLLWSDVFTDMVEIVAGNTGREFDDLTADTNLQTPIDTTIEEFTGAIDAVVNAALNGSLGYSTAVPVVERLVEQMMVVLGVPDAGAVMEEGTAEETDFMANLVEVVASNIQSGKVGEKEAAAFIGRELVERYAKGNNGRHREGAA